VCKNINFWGRSLRILMGIIFLGNGAFMWHHAMPGADIASRALQVSFMLLGAFSIYEGVVGWCALKAWQAARDARQRKQ
jgi:hypothetical protein